MNLVIFLSFYSMIQLSSIQINHFMNLIIGVNARLAHLWKRSMMKDRPVTSAGIDRTARRFGKKKTKSSD